MVDEMEFLDTGDARLRVLTTSARKPPLRSARFEAEIVLLPFSPRRFGPLTRFGLLVRPFRGRMSLQ